MDASHREQGDRRLSGSEPLYLYKYLLIYPLVLIYKGIQNLYVMSQYCKFYYSNKLNSQCQGYSAVLHESHFEEFMAENSMLVLHSFHYCNKYGDMIRSSKSIQLEMGEGKYSYYLVEGIMRKLIISFDYHELKDMHEVKSLGQELAKEYYCEYKSLYGFSGRKL